MAAVALLAAGYLAVREARDGSGLDVGSRGGLVAVLVATLAGMLAVVAVAFRPERGGLRRLALTSKVVAAVFLAALFGLWYLASSEVRDAPTQGTAVVARAEVDAVLAPYLARAVASPVGPPHQIPTGVFLQSVEFLNANNVEVHGYVWQDYAPGIPVEIVRGFVLPEAVDGAYGAEEIYREETAAGGERIGWSFHAVLRQTFDYLRYPFDHQEVSLRLWHPDLRRRAVLVPDFGAYPEIDPDALPGVGRDFVYQGWNPEFTAFSYVPRTYSSTFGLDGPTIPPGYPELYFTLGLKRQSLNVLFDHGFPQAVIALFLFATLFLTTRDEARRARYGSDGFEILRFCGALLFVAILAHNRLRESVASDRVVYLETMSFLVYLALLLIVLNAVLIVQPPRYQVIEYEDNAMPRIVFWPLLLGSLFLISLLILAT